MSKKKTLFDSLLPKVILIAVRSLKDEMVSEYDHATLLMQSRVRRGIAEGVEIVTTPLVLTAFLVSSAFAAVLLALYGASTLADGLIGVPGAGFLAVGLAFIAATAVILSGINSSIRKKIKDYDRLMEV